MSDAASSALASPPLGARLLERLQEPNPIVVRELRSTLRSPLFRRTLAVFVGLVGLVTLTGSTLLAENVELPAEVGKWVFQVFFGAAFTLLCLVAPAQGATAVSSEVEQRTLESLLLTGMAPGAIIRGKVAAIALSNGLILVALLPVVSVTFLFGGVSPVHVLAGYLGVGLFLVPAVAYGVAVSALLQKTRLALLVVLLTFPGVGLTVSSVVGVVGEAVIPDWGLGMHGPFWFADAFVVRPFHPETLGYLVALPAVASVLTTWLFLIGATTALTPSTGDRSTDFKAWTIVTTAAAAATTAGVTASVGGGEDAGGIHLVMTGLATPLFLLVGLVLSGEPAAAPRGPAGRRRWRWLVVPAFGPGLAGTLRFVWVVGAGLAAILVVVPALTRRLAHPGYTAHARFDVASLASALGSYVLMVAAVGLAAGLFRGIARMRPALARSSVVVLGVVWSVAALLITLIVDSDALDDLGDRLPPFLAMSPYLPTMGPAPFATGSPDDSAYVTYALGAALFLGIGATGSLVAARLVGRPRASARRPATPS